jgi:hypothetical protein
MERARIAFGFNKIVGCSGRGAGQAAALCGAGPDCGYWGSTVAGRSERNERAAVSSVEAFIERHARVQVWDFLSSGLGL